MVRWVLYLIFRNPSSVAIKEKTHIKHPGHLSSAWAETLNFLSHAFISPLCSVTLGVTSQPHYIMSVLVHPCNYNKVLNWLAYKKQKFILHSSRGWEVQDKSAGRLGVWWAPASLFTDGHLPIVSSYGGSSKGALWGPF